MGRTIRSFSRRELYEMAIHYVESPAKYSGDFFADMYGISKSTFYHILHKVVEESIVSIEVSKRIAEKAAENTFKYGGKGAEIVTYESYNRSIERRKVFRFGKEEAKRYVSAYIASNQTLENFSFNNYMQPQTLLFAIYDVTINVWLPKEKIIGAKEILFPVPRIELDEALTNIFSGKCTEKEKFIIHESVF